MKDKRLKAAAIRYDREKHIAPKVTAIGKGLVADNMIEKASEHHIPILEDAALVELLSELNLNETIPEELYQAVAEVFAFIYRTDQSME